MQTIGSTVTDNWSGIEESYRPTCKKIISYAFNHDLFKESDLAKTFLSGWWVQKERISKSVKLLVQANILSDIDNGTYTLHSKVEKEYLVANINKLR